MINKFSAICCYFAVTTLSLAAQAAPIRPPTHSECERFSEANACIRNDVFMQKYCRQACDDHFRSQRLQRLQRPIASSFFDLEATDIDGEVVDFADFEGKVIMVVNVASECGYTEQHYDEMINLYSSLSATGKFELLAFPCNQFGEQEPEGREGIKQFTEELGVDFVVMDKIDVNGLDTHDVYRFLKSVAGPDEIEWNFATYYVIDPDGDVEAYSDVTPLELRDILLDLLENAQE